MFEAISHDAIRDEIQPIDFGLRFSPYVNPPRPNQISLGGKIETIRWP